MVHTLFQLSFVIKRVLLNNQQRVVVHNVIRQNHLVFISFKGKFVENFRFTFFRKGAFGVSRKVLVTQVLVLDHTKTFSYPLSQLGQIISSFHLDHNFKSISWVVLVIECFQIIPESHIYSTISRIGNFFQEHSLWAIWYCPTKNSLVCDL